MRDIFMELANDESGMGVVEVILIIVVLVGLVAFFKDKINALVKEIWDSVTESAKDVY